MTCFIRLKDVQMLQGRKILLNEKIDYRYIPTREEMSQKYMNRGNTYTVNVKKVHFNKSVIVFPIPRKEDFGNIAHDVWYSRDELARIVF